MNRKQRRSTRAGSDLVWGTREQPSGATVAVPRNPIDQVRMFARGSPMSALGPRAESAVRIELCALADSMNVTSDIIRRTQALVLERIGARTWPINTVDTVTCPGCRKGFSIPNARRDAYESGVRTGLFALENAVGHLFNMICIMQMSSISGGAPNV